MLKLVNRKYRKESIALIAQATLQVGVQVRRIIRRMEQSEDIAD